MIITHKHTTFVKTAALLIATSVVLIAGWLHFQSTSRAADLTRFDPGNIMSDAVMSNKSTMSVQDIQNFLNSKNYCDNRNVHMAAWYPHLQYNIKDGRFVCMARDSFNGKSAAQIIWQVAQDYSINPQFLIVLLEKEQGLITDTWPNHVQYRTATGFGCPDTAPCDSQYFGLENQLRQAANLFRTVLNGGWSNYPVGNTYVQYHPNAACGGSVINIQNRATSALYRYTPYQPNQSALNAGYGTGDSCGAYGNRNTWRLFTDWFGDTSSGIHLDIVKATQDINNLHSQQKPKMGEPKGSPIPEYDGAPRVWRNYDKGVVVWTIEYGAQFIPYDSTYQRWRELGGSTGGLGVPTSPAVNESDDGRTWQNFRKGLVIFTAEFGGYEIVPGPLGDKWVSVGGSLGLLKRPVSSVIISENGNRRQEFENGIAIRKNINSPAYAIAGSIYKYWNNNLGILGMPTSDTIVESNGHTWQSFERGLAIQLPSGQTWPVVYGDFYSKWQELGGSFGVLGRPSSQFVTESSGLSWQFYENGLIVQKSKNLKAREVVFGPIYNRWQEIGGSNGILGTPQGSSYTEIDGRSWQYFERGVIIYSAKTGAWEVEGNFYGYWKENGGSSGRLGRPTSEKKIGNNDTRWQTFENGKIVWRPLGGWSIE